MDKTQMSLLAVLEDHSVILACITELMNKWWESNDRATQGHRLNSIRFLTIKIMLKSYSLQKLLAEVEKPRPLVKVEDMLDLSSVCAIARAQLESYLIFFYLFIQPTTDDEREFRINVYMLHTFLMFDNQTEKYYNSNSNLGDEKGYKSLVVGIQEDIKKSSTFLSFDKSRRESILKGGRAVLKGWVALIEESKLANDAFIPSYDLYANIAHSEYTSLLSIAAEIQDPQYSIVQTVSIIQAMVLNLSIFIRELAVSIDAVDIYNSLSQEKKNKLQHWAHSATDGHSSTANIDLC